MLLSGLAGYLALIGAVLLLWERPALLLATLLALTAITLLLGRSRRLAAYALAGALLGPSAETLAILAGAWRYTRTDGLIIPVWLPPAWGLASAYLVLIVDALLARRPGAAGTRRHSTGAAEASAGGPRRTAERRETSSVESEAPRA